MGGSIVPLVALSSCGADRVGDLKRLVAHGLYQPDPRAVASAMLADSSAREALGLDPRWSLVTRAPNRASWPAPAMKK